MLALYFTVLFCGNL